MLVGIIRNSGYTAALRVFVFLYGRFRMANRVSPESQLMIGMFNFAKNIVTIALGIVLGGYLILQIAEYRTKEILTKFQQQMQNAGPVDPPLGIRPPPK